MAAAPKMDSSGTHYFPPGPIGRDFITSDAFVSGIRGPIGSGKSTACVMKLVRNMHKQAPGPDGCRKRRTAIIRNTYPELKTTTIKTWHQWIPADAGKWVDQGPPSHRIRAVNRGRLESDWEVIFVALDRPEDVRKLLSMELSDAWINEAREIPKAILDGLTGRVGRYPAVRDGGCTDPQVIMDTNPPDTDHWWAKLADFPTPEFLSQNIELEALLRVQGALRADQNLYSFFAQPGGRTPGAENLKNLPRGYYEKAMAGKSEDWIKVYIDASYGFVMEGKPVYPEYRDNFHSKPFELNRMLPIYVGIDFGLTPAATICQRTVMGGWRVRDELVSEHMGAKRFGEMLGVLLRDKYRGCEIGGIFGDPAGNQEAQTDEETPFKILHSVGIEARPAPTNDFTLRREAVALYLGKVIDCEPALVIHPDCHMLRKAMSGGYHFARVQVLGQERFTDKPVKDMHSHVAESLQYAMVGAGEARTVVRRNPMQPRRKFAIMDHKIFT